MPVAAKSALATSDARAPAKKAAVRRPRTPKASPPSRPRIFVSIASYRDTECQWTIKDLFEKATHPERVFVGICWQFFKEQDADCFEVVTRPEQCRVMEVDARESQGVGWARSQVQSLWAGEEYFFQIDAHSRFEPGWDELCLEMLAACPSAKPVLSAYPTSYVPPDQLGPRNVVVILPKEFDDRGLLAFTSIATPEAQAPALPTPTAYVAGGLLFAPAAVIAEVPYDPYIYFTGEEIALAARLWTHGWDLFAPNKVVLFHEYAERPNKRRHWHDHTQWTQLSDLAMARVRHLLEDRPCSDPDALRDFDRYRLGDARPLADYEAMSGVAFRQQTIHGKTTHELEAALPAEARTARIGKRFTDIWRTNAWGNAESRSGAGSTLAQTEKLRPKLQQVLRGLHVRSLLDAGCGDLNWLQGLSSELALYLGVDTVDELVTDLRQRFRGRKQHFFNVADITTDRLPRADAILCRDVLTHLSLPLVMLALENFRASGARYLIATTFPRGSNDAIRTGAWQMIDLTAAPFNLPPPLLLISEELGGTSKSLGVWALDGAAQG
jgi:SAM-dependent methyltransferase